MTGLTEECREKSLNAVRRDVIEDTHDVSGTPLVARPHSIYGDVAAGDVGIGCDLGCESAGEHKMSLNMCFEVDEVYVYANMIENLNVTNGFNQFINLSK